jgi:dimethylargininase
MLALVRPPNCDMDAGQRTFVGSVPVDFERALAQHAAYVKALEACGCRVISLPPLPALPDATFVEDVAIVLDEMAILGSPGAASRRAEIALMEPEIGAFRPLTRIEHPATLEGGDVLRVGRTLWVGNSTRTNAAGIAALARIVGSRGYTVETVPVRGALHLKTGCTALPDGRLLLNPEWLDLAPLARFERIEIPRAEPFAANVLPLGNRILCAAEYPQTAALLAAEGYDILPVEISEFAKAEGGVTCLSIVIP